MSRFAPPTAVELSQLSTDQVPKVSLFADKLFAGKPKKNPLEKAVSQTELLDAAGVPRIKQPGKGHWSKVRTYRTQDEKRALNRLARMQADTATFSEVKGLMVKQTQLNLYYTIRYKKWVPETV